MLRFRGERLNAEGETDCKAVLLENGFKCSIYFDTQTFHTKLGSVLYDQLGTRACFCFLDEGGGSYRAMKLYLSWDTIQGKCLGSLCAST